MVVFESCTDIDSLYDSDLFSDLSSIFNNLNTFKQFLTWFPSHISIMVQTLM